MRIACTILALALLLSTQISAQSETSYDVEHECICLIDSIAPDTVIQFWRFTQSNNPGEYNVDVTFDFTGAYTPTGEVLSCKDYYLEDNPGGSGTAGTLAIWTGAHSLGNSNVTESGQILSSSFTGAFKPPAGTTAQQPAGSPGYLRYNTTNSGLEGYDGGAYRFLPWANADNWTNTYIPYSDGNQLITSANFLFRTSDFDGLIIGGADTGANGLNVRRLTGSGDIASFETNTGTDVLDIESTGLLSFAAGFSNNPGISWSGTGTAITGTSSGINATCSNSGGNKALRVVVGSTEIANIGGNQLGSQPTQTGVFVNSGSVFAAAVGGVTTTIRGGVGSTIGGPMVVLGGPSSNSNSNAGSTYLQGGYLGQAWFSNGGVPGDLYIQTFNDTDDSATHIATYNIPKILAKFTRGPAYNIELYELSATTSGIRTLTMEDDTVKYRIENIGAVSTSTDGSGDIAVTHSMGTTPTAVVVTVTGTTPYVCTVHTKGGTTFTVRFFDMAGAAVTSTAVTFDWLAKT